MNKPALWSALLLILLSISFQRVNLTRKDNLNSVETRRHIFLYENYRLFFFLIEP